MRFYLLVSLIALWATFAVAIPLPLRLGGLGSSLGKGSSSLGKGSSSSSSTSSGGGFLSGLFGGRKGGSSSSSSQPPAGPAKPPPVTLPKASPPAQEAAPPKISTPPKESVVAPLKHSSAAAPPKQSSAAAPAESASAKSVSKASIAFSASSANAASASSAVSVASSAASPATTPAASVTSLVTTPITTPATTTAVSSTSIDRQAWPTIPIAGARPPTFAEAQEFPKLKAFGGVEPNTASNYSAATIGDDFIPAELQRRGEIVPRAKKGKPTDPSLCPTQISDFDAHIDDCAPNECAFYSRVEGKEHDWSTLPGNNYALLRDKLHDDFIKTNKNSRCPNFWELASVNFANRANGIVPVLLPPLDAATARDPAQITSWPLKDNGEKTIWEDFEWPALQNNIKVTALVRFDQANNQHQILTRP